MDLSLHFQTSCVLLQDEAPGHHPTLFSHCVSSCSSSPVVDRVVVAPILYALFSRGTNLSVLSSSRDLEDQVGITRIIIVVQMLSRKKHSYAYTNHLFFWSPLSSSLIWLSVREDDERMRGERRALCVCVGCAPMRNRMAARPAFGRIWFR